MVGEDRGASELGTAQRDLFPERPGTAVLLTVKGRGVHGAEAGRLGHRTQGNNNIVLFAYRNLICSTVPLADDTLYSFRAILLAEIEISDTGVKLEHDAMVIEPLAERPHHGVVLVVDGAHDPL